MYTRHDERVAPYLFLIREWAKQSSISKHGGQHYDGLTPYMMTCFALFYLMRCQPPVLPSMMQLLTKQSSMLIFLLIFHGRGGKTKFS